jgi:hypothetical protein
MRPDGSFADIPDEVRRRVAEGERVALLLLDALGLRFCCATTTTRLAEVRAS